MSLLVPRLLSRKTVKLVAMITNGQVRKLTPPQWSRPQHFHSLFCLGKANPDVVQPKPERLVYAAVPVISPSSIRRSSKSIGLPTQLSYLVMKTQSLSNTVANLNLIRRLNAEMTLTTTMEVLQEVEIPESIIRMPTMTTALVAASTATHRPRPPRRPQTTTAKTESVRTTAALQALMLKSMYTRSSKLTQIQHEVITDHLISLLRQPHPPDLSPAQYVAQWKLRKR
jgi:hypothetical protein